MTCCKQLKKKKLSVAVPSMGNLSDNLEIWHFFSIETSADISGEMGLPISGVATAISVLFFMLTANFVTLLRVKMNTDSISNRQQFQFSVGWIASLKH